MTIRGDIWSGSLIVDVGNPYEFANFRSATTFPSMRLPFGFLTTAVIRLIVACLNKLPQESEMRGGDSRRAVRLNPTNFTALLTVQKSGKIGLFG